MGSGEERTRTASDTILPPKLLLSAALAALIIAAPAGDRTSALAMNLRSGFGAARLGGAGAVHLNSGPRVAAKGTVGGTSVGGGREVAHRRTRRARPRPAGQSLQAGPLPFGALRGQYRP